MSKTILFNKPFNVLSQFTDNSEDADARETLSAYIDLPDVYAAGRLDRDSEGLMILTDDGKLQARLSDPKFKMPKSYWVLVEGEINHAAIATLCKGVQLKDGMTKPAKAQKIDAPDGLWERDPPVRYRKSITDTWINLTITEGRNRQIRRMTASVGFPTLRLIRHQIGEIKLGELGVGKWRDIQSQA